MNVRTSPRKPSPVTLPSVSGGQRSVGALTSVPSLIRKFGIDPDSVLAEAGIDPAILAHPSNRIAYSDLAILLETAARHTGCSHFGLVAGCAWRLSDLGTIGELMRHSPTVGDALYELVLYQHLNSEGGVAYLITGDEFVDLGFALYLPISGGRRHIYDAVMGAAVNFLRDICGTAWAPSEVFFPHSVADGQVYYEHFRARLHFDATFSALRFPVRLLTQSIQGADASCLSRALERVQAEKTITFVEIVSRTLRTLLLAGSVSGNALARSLGMHRRTFNRRLTKSGTTFQAVLDAVRFAVATELLENPAVSLSDITMTLGYADTASFFRAFRRWTGTTPSEWRRSATSMLLARASSGKNSA